MHSKRSYEIALAQGLSPERAIYTLDDALTVLRYTASYGESVQMPRWPFDVERLLVVAAKVAMQADRSRQDEVRRQHDASRITYEAYWHEVERGADYVRRHADDRVTEVPTALDYLTGGRHPFLDHLSREVDVIEHTAHRRACGTEVQYLSSIPASSEQVQGIIDCVSKNALVFDIVSEARAVVPHYAPNHDFDAGTYWREVGRIQRLRSHEQLDAVAAFLEQPWPSDRACDVLRHTASTSWSFEPEDWQPGEPTVREFLFDIASRAMLADVQRPGPPPHSRRKPLALELPEYLAEVHRIGTAASHTPDPEASVWHSVARHPFLVKLDYRLSVLEYTDHIDALEEAPEPQSPTALVTFRHIQHAAERAIEAKDHAAALTILLNAATVAMVQDVMVRM
jgi:hypothetical protein